jgi:hypothetical protein
MSDQAAEGILKRIDAYGTAAGFAEIVADALALVPASRIDAFKRELGRRCGMVPPSTVDRWARGDAVPGDNVRRHVLDQLRDLLVNRP